MEYKHTKRLSELRVKERGTVCGFLCDCSCVLRLQELGLCIGTDVEVVKAAPFGDPIELKFRGFRLCIRKSDVNEVEVEVEVEY